jgi:hypothetical protein
VDFTVVRALTPPGASFAEIVDKYEPYDKIVDEVPQTREALRALIQDSIGQRQAYVFVNSRLEGNAPLTIDNIVLPRETANPQL